MRTVPDEADRSAIIQKATNPHNYKEQHEMTDKKKLTTAAGAPVPDNQNVVTAGPRGPILLQDIWLLEKLAHFDRKVRPTTGTIGRMTTTTRRRARFSG